MIIVTSRSFSRHPSLRSTLMERYPFVRFNDQGRSLSGAALVDFLDGAEAAIVGLEKVDGQLLDALPKLKVISKFGVGVDNIDMAAMKSRNVRLGWTGGVNRRSVSELAISMMIALLRHLPTANATVRSGEWRQIIGRQLSDCTVGIIGCGHVGKDLARLLRAFGSQVLANDILDFPKFYETHDIEAVTLDALLARSDIVTLHVSLNPSSFGMLSTSRLEMMKPGSILINLARGGLLDENSLKKMLISGRIASAALDVFASEPPTDQELLQLPNVIATPHIGGSAEEAIKAMGMAAIEGLSSAVVPNVDGLT